jgi:cell wall-associated NlpC family hydrolase
VNRPLPLRARLVCVIARRQKGKPYQYGAEGPNSFDCSGLAVYCFKWVGKKLLRTSQLQWEHGTPIGRKAIRESDLLFFVGAGPGAPPRHMGIYLGSGLFIEAPHTGVKVRISHLDGYPGYMGARRYIK